VQRESIVAADPSIYISFRTYRKQESSTASACILLWVKDEAPEGPSNGGSMLKRRYARESCSFIRCCGASMGNHRLSLALLISLSAPKASTDKSDETVIIR
jgi:hypothetical protein